MLRGTQKERGMIISEKEDKLARESRKKKMDWISSHCGTRTAATKSSRVKDENAYMCVTFRPPPRGMPPKFILLPLL